MLCECQWAQVGGRAGGQADGRPSKRANLQFTRRLANNFSPARWRPEARLAVVVLVAIRRAGERVALGAETKHDSDHDGDATHFAEVQLARALAIVIVAESASRAQQASGRASERKRWLARRRKKASELHASERATVCKLAKLGSPNGLALLSPISQ